MQPLRELRQKVGAQLSDEEFLLRATMPQTLVDAMAAAGPAQREYDPSTKPVMNLIRTLTARRDLWSVSLEKQGFRLMLNRSGRESAAADPV